MPDDVIAGLASAMDDFFGLDPDAKLAARAPASANRGYTAPKSECLSLSLGVESATWMNDFFEASNVERERERPPRPGARPGDVRREPVA